MVEEGLGSTSRRSSCKDTGVVLDAAAIAHLTEHLHVVVSPLLDTLSLDELVVLPEIVYTLRKLAVKLLKCGLKLVIAYNIVGGRENSCVGHNCLDLACDHVYLGDTVYLIAEVFNADCRIR